ncbi:hypothetical protein QGM71_16695 [Virgibacillus sp. C22-A2]|uniref:Uncharacterized protein n=1 Tax=Virgibacillus tibetensis TaxID=3042313 RepID=A0ABU6KJ31_9BACI|nr:hypothetical protein [Virgibacillus sp. C22-A2]
MYLGIKDCIICEIDKDLSVDKIKKGLSSTTFEVFNFKVIDSDILEVEYKWLDSIKIKDKIVSRKQKTVKSWIYHKINHIIVFANSESDVNFFKIKIQNSLHVIFKDINIFEKWKKDYLNKGLWIADLTNIQIKNNIIPYDDEEMINISIHHLDFKEINAYLTKRLDSLVSLTFKYNGSNNITFYLDPKSIISFPDTIRLNEMIEVFDEVLNDQK